MAKKTVKPVASGVDLSQLSLAQLEALVVEARAKALEASEKEDKAALKALKESGEFKKIKEEWLALGKEGKKLARAAKFDLVLPIRFTMNTEGPYCDEVFSYAKLVSADLFNHSFTATLLKEGGNLTKKQRETLAATVNDYAENACDDIFDLLPDELVGHYDAFAEKMHAFVDKAKAAGVGLEDLA